jgi:hypothetical protein
MYSKYILTVKLLLQSKELDCGGIAYCGVDEAPYIHEVYPVSI